MFDLILMCITGNLNSIFLNEKIAFHLIKSLKLNNFQLLTFVLVSEMLRI